MSMMWRWLLLQAVLVSCDVLGDPVHEERLLEKDSPTTRSPTIIWPENAAVLTMHSKKGGTYKIKVATEAELYFWAEDTSSRRQFQAIWDAATCKGLSDGMLSPAQLAALIVEAFLSDPTKEGKREASATLDVADGRLDINIFWTPSKILEREFRLFVREKTTSQADRLEARMDNVENRLGKDLSGWSLFASPHSNQPWEEGSQGSFALSGNYFLIQDTDFRKKPTGVSTQEDQHGCIQATFPAPVHVKSMLVAAFLERYATLCDGELNVETLRPSGVWDTIKTLPNDTEEAVIPVNAEGLAWRLCGRRVSISKLIFH